MANIPTNSAKYYFSCQVSLKHRNINVKHVKTCSRMTDTQNANCRVCSYSRSTLTGV